jgi:hypothetical protein
MDVRRTALPLLAAVAAAVATLAPAPALGGMTSTQISRNLCETTGGGRFVELNPYPGEYLDRRLIRDMRWMRRKYAIFVTDGYSTSGAHSPNGEHPIGLALDIVPDWGRGGSWKLIDDLAEKTEPVQNQPKPPWRWVGWDGDANHGWGNHLHLSWSHSPTPFGEPARTVYTRKCPLEGDGRSAMVASKAPRGFSSAALETEIAPAVPELNE